LDASQRRWVSAQLFAGDGANVPAGSLKPALPITAFQTGAFAGSVVSVTAKRMVPPTELIGRPKKGGEAEAGETVQVQIQGGGHSQRVSVSEHQTPLFHLLEKYRLTFPGASVIFLAGNLRESYLSRCKCGHRAFLLSK
jgi:hypothetical protein